MLSKRNIYPNSEAKNESMNEHVVFQFADAHHIKPHSEGLKILLQIDIDALSIHSRYGYP